MSKNRGGLKVEHKLNAEQHRQWRREMLAGNGNDRSRGRSHLLCWCRHCDWYGKFHTLDKVDLSQAIDAARPNGFCPKCGVRAFWAKLSEGQAAVLAP